jgi:hypothetical protein
VPGKFSYFKPLLGVCPLISTYPSRRPNRRSNERRDSEIPGLPQLLTVDGAASVLRLGVAYPLKSANMRDSFACALITDLHEFEAALDLLTLRRLGAAGRMRASGRSATGFQRRPRLRLCLLTPSSGRT